MPAPSSRRDAEGFGPARRSPLGLLLRALIRAYQLVLSPLLGPSCRYHPSCSEYAREAIAVHGPARGLWLAALRLGRCHPWGGHGFDPVPPAPAAGGKSGRHG